MARKHRRSKRIFAVSLSVDALYDACGGAIPRRVIKAGIFDHVPARLAAVKVGRSIMVNVRQFERWLEHFPKVTLKDWKEKAAAATDKGGPLYDL
jgi:hypothetical protein